MMAFDPANVEVWSAVAVAGVTVVLVVVNIVYVVYAKRLADEAARTNDQAAANARLAVQMAAPVLTIHEGPDADSLDGGGVRIRVKLGNSGSGVATELEMFSDWPQPFVFDAAIGWHDPPIVLTAFLPNRPVGFPDAPKLTEWRFTDLSGTRYRQLVGGRPAVI